MGDAGALSDTRDDGRRVEASAAARGRRMRVRRAGLARLILQHRKLLVQADGGWMPRIFAQERDHALERAARLELTRCNRKLETHELDQVSRLFRATLELFASLQEVPDVNQLPHPAQAFGQLHGHERAPLEVIFGHTGV